MDYKYKEKKIRLPEFHYEFSAIFLENHSRVKALICEYRDHNADDGWANIRDWRRYMAIMWKGTNKWVIIPGNHPDYEWATSGLGWFMILKRLEDEPTQIKFAIQQLKGEIEDQKDFIHNRKVEIKRLEHKIKELKART